MPLSSPFSGTFPLSSSPYLSRITSNFDNTVNKNYVLSGFRPGYGLQASELNEIQELFYLNQNLSNRCIHNWGKVYSGAQFPFWNGATPLDPTQVFTSSGSGSIIVTIPNSLWIYLIDGGSNGTGSGYWVKNPQTIQTITVQKPTTPGLVKYGFTYTKEFIDSDSDTTLKDNSNASNATMNIPGATRYAIKNLSLAQFNGQSLFSELFGAKLTTSGAFGIFWPSSYTTQIASAT